MSFVSVSVLGWLSAVLGALVVELVAVAALARTVRTFRVRRRDARIAQVRPQLYALIDGGALQRPLRGPKHRAEGPELDTLVLGVLPQLRGADRANLRTFLDERGVLERAREQLGASSAVVRAEAAELLGDADDSASAPEIRRLLGDPAQQVRVSAARALGRLADVESIGPLLAALQPQAARIPSGTVGMALLRMGAQAAPALRSKLDAAQPATRALCAELLGQLGDLAAAMPLVRRVANEPDAACRIAMARALGRIGSPVATAQLMSLTAGDRVAAVRVAAAWALGVIGDEAATDVLCTALHDAEHDVATAAAAALWQVAPERLDDEHCARCSRHARAAQSTRRALSRVSQVAS